MTTKLSSREEKPFSGQEVEGIFLSSKMSQLQQLKLFFNERLAAAAEEIFGAVERTMLEYHNDIYSLKEDKHVVLLTLAEGLDRAEEEVFTAVSQEVSMSETEASTQPSHTKDCQVFVKQDTSAPGFSEPQDPWPSQDQGKPQDLLECDVIACLKCEQSTQSSSCCQTRTVASGEADLLPGSSTEWVKTEEEAGGCGGSDFWQPLSLDSGDGGDTSDAEWTESGGSNSCSKTTKSKKRAKQKQNSPSLNTKQRTNQRPFCCKLCGESFLYRSLLMVHVKSHANSRAVLCPPNHAASAERGIEPSETHRSNTGEDNLCYVCGKTFTTRSHLKRHMLVHTGQKPHCCKECGKRFARGECLRILMGIHTVDKPYTCEVCGKGFRQRGNMMCHIRTHTGEKPHHCGICSRPFAYKKDMMRHMQVHAKM